MIVFATSASLALTGVAVAQPMGRHSTPSPAASEARPASGQWTEVWRDDFDGAGLDRSKWAVYKGAKTKRHPSNTFVKNGVLTLRTTKINGEWHGAGVSNSRSFKQTYGKFLIRARVDPGYGTRATALLWPAGGGWPPEVDFMEMGGSDPGRTKNNLTNHYGSTNKMQHASMYGDFTAWHTIGVEWTPSELVYTLDGVVKARMVGQSPSRAMWLGLQTRTGQDPAARPNAGTPAKVDFEIDWVRIYKEEK